MGFQDAYCPRIVVDPMGPIVFPHFVFPYLCGVRIAQDDRPASPMRDRLAHLYRGLPTWTLVGWRLIQLRWATFCAPDLRQSLRRSRTRI